MEDINMQKSVLHDGPILKQITDEHELEKIVHIHNITLCLKTNTS